MDLDLNVSPPKEVLGDSRDTSLEAQCARSDGTFCSADTKNDFECVSNGSFPIDIEVEPEHNLDEDFFGEYESNSDIAEQPHKTEVESPNTSSEEEHEASSDTDLGEESFLDRLIEHKLEVGTEVKSLDQAYLLYCEYARLKGFSVKKGSQEYFFKTTEIRMKIFNCCCQGQSNNTSTLRRISDYKKHIRRCDCPARLRVSRERDGPWKVCRFYKDHNHELVPPDQSYLLRSSRNLTNASKSLLEALNSAGIGVAPAFRFMEKESGGIQNIGFTKRDAYNHISASKKETKVANADANSLIQFFRNKSNTEPFFYWNVQLDDDGRLMNMFYRDSRSSIDYECFGDVLSVDTTYRTNKYDLVCAPFIGTNHHMKNVMFGLAFLSDETTSTFEWLFSSFLDSMHGKEPDVVFSDQCVALMKGIDSKFISSTHRLCQWHVNRNATQRFGKLNGDKEFKKLWHHLMNGCESEDEFEKKWACMIQHYNLGAKTWYSNMYKLRRRWASVYSNQKFCAGLHATSRSESTNKVIKNLCSRSGSLHEFVLQYEKIQNEWRNRESADDTLCIGMPGQFVSNNRLLLEIAKVLTRTAFKAFEVEATHSINVDIIQQPCDLSVEQYEFIVTSGSKSSREMVVRYTPLLNSASCSCCMFETSGVLCCHIFKVYYSLNIKFIPDRYLLNRYSRVAKNRIANLPFGKVTEDAGNDTCANLSFISYVMRSFFDLVGTAKHVMKCRTLIIEKIEELRNEIQGILLKDDCKHKGIPSVEHFGDQLKEMQNPPIPKRGAAYNSRTRRPISTNPRNRKKIDKAGASSSNQDTFVFPSSSQPSCDPFFEQTDIVFKHCTQ